MEKKSGNGNRSGKRGVRDLPLSDAATPDVKGGFLGSVVKSIGKAIGGVVKGIA